METLVFQLNSKKIHYVQSQVLCGVVGSGNLEVLVKTTQDDECKFIIHTSAEGFSEIWLAVLQDFTHRYAVAGLYFELNDMGATPAVVNLRLSQAVTMLQGEESYV